ncbi:low-affinity phosphate transporter, partial [Blyttiomyces sp. JEL0837]
ARPGVLTTSFCYHLDSAYSNLKKWVYLIEKAKLGIVTLPPSYHEVDPATFLAASQPQRGADEETPLLSDASSAHRSATDTIPNQEQIEAFFTQALDDQLEKIVGFYSRKEKELYSAVEDFIGDVSYYEGFEESLNSQAPRGRNPEPRIGGGTSFASMHAAAGVHAGVGGSSSTSASNQDVVSVPPTKKQSRKSILPEQQPLLESGSSPLGQHPSVTVDMSRSTTHNANNLSYNFWNRADNQVQRNKFRKQATACFVALNELDDYRELNSTGFSKILKKYEKVTGYRLKAVYMRKVESAYPFTKTAVDNMRLVVDRVIATHARVATENNVAQATAELNATLMEHIVWERNTIWMDM